jgi:phage terminase large subunit-like protein
MKRFRRGSYTHTAINYAKSIITGKVAACWQVKTACQRFLNDFDRTDIVYREDRADHACAFMEALPHVIGPLAGELIRLEPFQIFIVVNLFGWHDPVSGLRRYREAFILLPRGSGKSTLAAPIGLYMTFCQGQGGAEGLSGATSMAQADAVFIPAKRMAEMSPDLAAALGIETSARSIYQVSTGSTFKPVIAKTRDGGLPWIAIADELHQALDSTQLNAFRTGMGKRRGADPMLLIISTAGTNVAGVCRQEQLYFEAVLKGTITDDSKFCLVYTIDDTDDWRDFAVWRKANPGYAVSVDEKHLRSEYEKSLQSPSYQATCLTKYLNVWQNTATGWLNSIDWSKAARSDLLLSSAVRCWIGVDLSTRTDVTAVTVLAEMPDGTKALFPFLFLPQGALDRSKNAKAYQEWIAAGALIQTEGSASDHQAVEDTIRELCRTHQVQAVLFDSWQAAGMIQRLQVDGIECQEFGQNARNFNGPMTDFEADLMNGKIVHPDNACLNWMASNISVATRGILKSPCKPTGQDHLKIDGIIAGLMAYAASNVAPPPPPVDVEFFFLD